MKPFPKQTPLVLLAVLGGGCLIFLLNAFFPVPVETVFALIGMGLFLAGMLACIVAAIWAFRSLTSEQGRRTSGILAPLATIVIGSVVWAGVIASAVAFKNSLDARDKPHEVGGQTEQRKHDAGEYKKGARKLDGTR